MVDYITGMINSSIIQGYVNRVFEQDISLDSFLFALIISLIIGFSALTIRYTLNFKDEEEYKKWRNEHWPTKIFLALMVGALAYLTVSVFLEFIVILGSIMVGQSYNMEFVIGKGLVGIIMLAVIYCAGAIYLLSMKQKKPYEDIKEFSLISLVASLIITLLAVTISFFRHSFGEGVFSLIFLILILGMIFLSSYMGRKKKANN